MEPQLSSFLTNISLPSLPNILALLVLLPILLTPIIHFLIINKRSFSSSPSSSLLLPPSPPSLPIIGHLHLLSLPLHHSLSRLSSLHNNSPLLLLRLGSRLALLISSASAAEQCFTKHDLTFANRPTLPSSQRLSYNFTTLVAAPYGPHWRNLRRIATAELFSSSCLNYFSHVISEEVVFLIKQLSGGCGFRKVEVREKLDELALNVVMRMMVGRRCDEEEGRRFRWVVKEGFELVKESSVGDFLPFLRRVGNVGREKRMVRLEKEADELFDKAVEEMRRRRRRGEEGEERTIVGRLLDLQEEDREYYTDEIIKGVILTMIAAGTDTTAETLEWAMSLLLNNPRSLQKVRSEIELLVGHDRRLIQVSDLCNLPYLHSILKETLRLYPAAPLLLPHESSQDCTIAGFHVPRGTILFVNAYHIQRDPNIWEEPKSFKPERFMEGAATGLGYKIMMMPFGMGRRSCPGEGLAMRIMGFALGAMVQCLEWRRLGEEEVDMEEGAGMTMPKAKPLEALCMPRGIIV
ncbi:hypothetical protein IEQ34_003706 [Dendrobium chrysotoxum]|uniref:Cytochrome P450 n=1 Tax=Dendrobium chrysotoxum TaxID=161865 RepID=A0AAV7HEG8_DENCH|nr:hypothetical protein IEQ34_003706 [Dendrobium chrysotoxum]